MLLDDVSSWCGQEHTDVSTTSEAGEEKEREPHVHYEDGSSRGLLPNPLGSLIRRAARKVLITLNQTPAQRTRITPRLKGCLDNAPRRPRGPQYMHLGTLLQGRLPKVGLGLVLAPVQDFWCRLP